MDRIFKIFHYASVLQYPFYAIGVYYAYKPLIMGMESVWIDLNSSLTFIGIALSFTSFTDASKITKLSKKAFEKPKIVNGFIFYLVSLAIIIFTFGLFAFFFAENPNLNSLGTGILILSIGIIGLLKLFLEAIKNHRELA